MKDILGKIQQCMKRSKVKNGPGMPENSEKFCGAGAQSIHICGADK